MAMANAPRKVVVSEEDFAAAMKAEAELAERAAELRGETDDPLQAHFSELWSLAREPFHRGFLQEVTAGKGKPYPSKGVRSLQVQINRMDNVWTPLWWGWETTPLRDDRTLVEVRVWIGRREDPIVERRAVGGVDQGSTKGNVAKGSETNAAKLAFARIGPGQEVYLGAADFDPDTDEDAAEQQAKGNGADKDPARPLPPDKVEPLKTAVTAAGLDDHLAMKLAAFGVDAIEKLTVEQALGLYEWAKGEATGEAAPE